MKPAHDPVNHPKHYTFGKIEVITAIEDWKLGFHLGNVVKYVARAEHKGNILEDLRKARWYLDRKIATLEKTLDTDAVQLEIGINMKKRTGTKEISAVARAWSKGETPNR